jgi:hypothetical protein
MAICNCLCVYLRSSNLFCVRATTMLVLHVYTQSVSSDWAPPLISSYYLIFHSHFDICFLSVSFYLRGWAFTSIWNSFFFNALCISIYIYIYIYILNSFFFNALCIFKLQRSVDQALSHLVCTENFRITSCGTFQKILFKTWMPSSACKLHVCMYVCWCVLTCLQVYNTCQTRDTWSTHVHVGVHIFTRVVYTWCVHTFSCMCVYFPDKPLLNLQSICLYEYECM